MIYDLDDICIQFVPLIGTFEVLNWLFQSGQLTPTKFQDSQHTIEQIIHLVLTQIENVTGLIDEEGNELDWNNLTHKERIQFLNENWDLCMELYNEILRIASCPEPVLSMVRNYWRNAYEGCDCRVCTPDSNYLPTDANREKYGCLKIGQTEIEQLINMTHLAQDTPVSNDFPYWLFQLQMIQKSEELSAVEKKRKSEQRKKEIRERLRRHKSNG